MSSINPVIDARKTSIFEVMTRLALEHDAINLGQGFPDEDGPEDVRRFAAEATVAGPNQYPPMMGTPELRQAAAAHNARFYGLDYDWNTETLVTAGATEALASAFQAFLTPGEDEEAIVFEPAYDAYFDAIEGFGGAVRPVALKAPGWDLDADRLAAAITPKTRMIVLNTPVNPVGKVFDEDALAAVAKQAIANDLVVISDEVYEHMTFDGRRHRTVAALPGMRERTVRLSSAGKTFSLTGWKIGYSAGPASLISAMARAHQYLVFASAPALQKAVAHGLAKDDAYFGGLARDMQAKRDRLASGLKKTGFGVLPAEGTYFLTADIAPLGHDDDAAFCRAITEEAGVAAVPVSAFYHRTTADPPRNYVRFCFAKQDAVLDEAAARLKRYFG